jgi:mono/diheme cytochrome c family protein
LSEEDSVRWSDRRWPKPSATLTARIVVVGLTAFALLSSGPRRAAAQDEATPTPITIPDRSGAELYQAACASCHGVDGTGAEATFVAFEEEVPDFTQCNFASREPDADWIWVAHQGGPVRGFSNMMPAFGDALTMDELGGIIDHVRTFCGNDAWPRGELNLPRALYTEKAFPEDEAVFTTEVALDGLGSVMNEIVYERRVGARHQFEVVVPFGWQEQTLDLPGEDGLDVTDTDWNGGLGDVALGWKTAVWHSFESGSIFSLAGEIIFPTGNEDDGFGKGTVVFEPFLAFGQILPSDAFFQFQGGFEFPTDLDKAGSEAFWRLTLGKSFAQGGFGRTWSPMVEILGAAELEGGEPAVWDMVPQVQITLNTRQHIRLNVGLRVPLNETSERSTEFVVYLLWDWFDGGFFDGW